jgi:hypothetical protein
MAYKKKGSGKKRCRFGVNKNTGRCLKNKRRRASAKTSSAKGRRRPRLGRCIRAGLNKQNRPVCVERAPLPPSKASMARARKVAVSAGLAPDFYSAYGDPRTREFAGLSGYRRSRRRR